MKYVSVILLVSLFQQCFAQNHEVNQVLSFLEQREKEECLSKRNTEDLKELFASGSVYMKNDRLEIKEDRFGNFTFYLSGLCNELASISIRHYKSLDEEYMFVYRRFSENREAYGQLQLYIKHDSTWEAGQNLRFGWQHFFQIS